MTSGLTIGKLARAARVPVSTVRYYERAGLLQPERRSGGNYRLFGPEALERLRFIRAAQGVGFTLDDVMAVLGLGETAPDSPLDVKSLIDDRLQDLENRSADLEYVRKVLCDYREACDEPAEERLTATN